MRDAVEDARMAQDSIGGTIECCVTGIDAGYGEPMFEGVEGVIAKAVFGVPAIKGIEFGKGFELSTMRGSQSNDPFEYKDGRLLQQQTTAAVFWAELQTECRLFSVPP